MIIKSVCPSCLLADWSAGRPLGAEQRSVLPAAAE